MKWILPLALIFISSLAQANYRAYALRITNQKTKESRLVYSTLDWLQYYDYHYLQPYEVVTLEDTWMCWRRNKKRFRPICKRPGTEPTLRADFQGPSPY